MAKCTNCRSCLKKVVFLNKERYLVCTLCLKVFRDDVLKIVEVEEIPLIRQILEQANIGRIIE
jgi:hypothetical protein